MNKKAMLIVLCLVTMLLAALSLLGLLASSPETSAESPDFPGENPVGLYVTTILFLVASTVWYLIYRTQNRR